MYNNCTPSKALDQSTEVLSKFETAVYRNLHTLAQHGSQISLDSTLFYGASPLRNIVT